MHCNIDSRATRPPFTQFKTCTVCEKMVRELISLLMSSASNRSKQPGGSSPFGGNLSYLHLIFQDLQRVYNDIVMSHNRYATGGLCFSFGGGLLMPWQYRQAMQNDFAKLVDFRKVESRDYPLSRKFIFCTPRNH